MRRGLGEGRGLEVILCEGGCVNTFVALFDEFFCALLYMMAGKRREEWGGEGFKSLNLLSCWDNSRRL